MDNFHLWNRPIPNVCSNRISGQRFCDTVDIQNFYRLNGFAYALEDWTDLQTPYHSEHIRMVFHHCKEIKKKIVQFHFLSVNKRKLWANNELETTQNCGRIIFVTHYSLWFIFDSSLIHLWIIFDLSLIHLWFIFDIPLMIHRWFIFDSSLNNLWFFFDSSLINLWWFTFDSSMNSRLFNSD